MERWRAVGVNAALGAVAGAAGAAAMAGAAKLEQAVTHRVRLRSAHRALLIAA
jgi:hypothetical protein